MQWGQRSLSEFVYPPAFMAQAIRDLWDLGAIFRMGPRSVPILRRQLQHFHGRRRHEFRVLERCQGFSVSMNRKMTQFQTYSADITSYDYSAMISEGGDFTPLAYAIQVLTLFWTFGEKLFRTSFAI